MRKGIDFKNDILPHLVAIVVFVIITIGYFSPVFFKNQSISQYDIQQWQGGAKELIDYREQTGEEGLWTNSMFSGMPAYLVDVNWSDDIIVGLHRIYTVGLPHPMRMIFAALLSFYILALSFKIRPYIAIAGAIVFGLSSFMIIGIAAGHNARIGAIAYMPLVIAGIHLTLTGKRWLGLGISTAALALHLRVNHLQITYYLLLTVVIYGIVMLIASYRNGTLKDFSINIGLLIVSAAIAVSSFFGELWSTYEYSEFSIRGKSELQSIGEDESSDGLDKSYAFQYSNGIFEPLTLFVPDVLGGASSNYLVGDPESYTYRALQRSGDQETANQLIRFSSSYFGKQSVAAPYYAGAVSFLLLVIGILFAEKKYKIWLLTVLGLGIILSWGSNFASFNYMMFDYFPGYNKFRSVTFTIVLAILGISLLGSLGLESLLRTGLNPQTRNKLFIALGVS